MLRLQYYGALSSKLQEYRTHETRFIDFPLYLSGLGDITPRVAQRMESITSSMSHEPQPPSQII